MEQNIADATDRRILQELGRNARVSNAELAEKVGLSPSPCLRRVRRLEDAGLILGYTTRLSPLVEGWTMTAIVMVRLSRQHEAEITMFEAAVREWAEVAECHLVTGTPDYVLKVMSRSLADYEQFIRGKVARLTSVASIETCFIMNSIK
jgi:Lrp/AsnC family transcriptional regulator, leucine-responsive regulatory protein